MVFKEESVRERLKRLEEVITRLSRYRGQPRDDFAADFERQWIVERGFILAAECLVDIATHILGGKFSIQAADHEDAIRRLGEEGVITRSLTEKLRGLGGFRDLLVHDYARIDPAKVHEYLEDELEALSDFIREVTIWIVRNPS